MRGQAPIKPPKPKKQKRRKYIDVIEENKKQIKRTNEMKVRVNDIEYKKIKELAYLYGKPMADIFRDSTLSVSKSHKG
ncbi:hypothetical protein, partial [Streptomyces sp. P17]|uniref:hypothetical protein n=1 Tax=Streptomyces sp. P17 TaxID=3074716 RepID=UPI0028F4177D